MLSALAVGLHYHRHRLAAGLGGDRPYRRHRQPQFVPELAAPVAAVAVLPAQDRQLIKRDAGVEQVAPVPSRALRRDRRRSGRHPLQRYHDRARRHRGQLLQHPRDARIRPDVVQGRGAQDHDDAPGGVGVRADLQAPCNTQYGSFMFEEFAPRPRLLGNVCVRGMSAFRDGSSWSDWLVSRLLAVLGIN